MKKLITWRGDILKKFKFFLIILYFIIQPTLTSASERWILDTSLSTVEFELPVLFAKNVKGKFNSIDGFIELEIELTIKGKNAMVPLKVYVSRLAEELVQIKSELVFSRTNFEIGIGQWSNTSILKDKVKIKTNLFLFKE